MPGRPAIIKRAATDDRIIIVQKLVCVKSRINICQLLGKSRIEVIKNARFLGVRLCVEYGLCTNYNSLATRFGYNDHTMIGHAKKRALDLIETDAGFRRMYESCKQFLDDEFKISSEKALKTTAPDYQI